MSQRNRPRQDALSAMELRDKELADKYWKRGLLCQDPNSSDRIPCDQPPYDPTTKCPQPEWAEIAWPTSVKEPIESAKEKIPKEVKELLKSQLNEDDFKKVKEEFSECFQQIRSANKKYKDDVQQKEFDISDLKTKISQLNVDNKNFGNKWKKELKKANEQRDQNAAEVQLLKAELSKFQAASQQQQQPQIYYAQQPQVCYTQQPQGQYVQQPQGQYVQQSHGYYQQQYQGIAPQHAQHR